MAAPEGNKNAVGNDGGRPPMFSDPDMLQEKINEYFDTGRDTRTIATGNGTVEIPVYTICDLAYFLGFESRQSLYDYEDKIKFTYIIKRARLKIESKYEQNLQFNNATGSIFALKNMAWYDRQELTGKDGKDLNAKVTIELIDRSSQVKEEDASSQ